MVLSQHSQPKDRPPCTKSRLLRNWRCANTWAKDSGTKAYKGSNEWEGEMYCHVLVACPLYFWGLLPSTLSAGVWSTKKLLDLKNPPSTKQKQFPPSIYTPPKFDLAPKKRYLEDYHLLLGPGNFQGPNSWNWVSPQPQLLQPRRRQRGRLGDVHHFHPDDLWCPRRAASRFSEQQVVPWS